MNIEKIKDLYNKELQNAKETFLSKSKRYNYAFFQNDIYTAFFDVKRKYERLRAILEGNYCKGELQNKSETIKVLIEESEDLANYSIMFRVFLKLIKEENELIKKDINERRS